MSEFILDKSIPRAKVYDSIPELDNQKPPKPVPTEGEIWQARETYLTGMNHRFPGVDPRLSLLGMQDSPYSYLYKTEAYGHDLIKVPNRKDKIIKFITESLHTCVMIYIGYRISHH